MGSFGLKYHQSRGGGLVAQAKVSSTAAAHDWRRAAVCICGAQEGLGHTCGWWKERWCCQGRREELGLRAKIWHLPQKMLQSPRAGGSERRYLGGLQSQGPALQEPGCSMTSF